MGTISQGRWNLLASANDVEDVCAALPWWIARVEQEEKSKGIPSAQFWKGIKIVLDLDCSIGCNPRVAPSCFPQALNGQGEARGIGLPSPLMPSV